LLLPVAHDAALGVVDQHPVGVGVQSLAIDAHRRCGDNAADRLIDQPLEQDGSTDVVTARVALDLVHRLADADLRRQVHDAVDALQGAGDCVAVAHVGVDELGLTSKIGRPSTVAVNLRDQCVEHAYLVAARQQLAGHEPPDEARAAGDQNRLAHRFPPTSIVITAPNSPQTLANRRSLRSGSEQECFFLIFVPAAEST
jgi:hypothetical protein